MSQLIVEEVKEQFLANNFFLSMWYVYTNSCANGKFEKVDILLFPEYIKRLKKFKTPIIIPV